MTLHHAAILGTIQGLTEVLPISSSAHLILIPLLLGWGESGLTFDVALHLGTLIALVLYFRRDIGEMFAGFLSVCRHRSLATPRERLPLIIIVASIPAAFVGKGFDDLIETYFRTRPTLISLCLIIFGIFLHLADRFGRREITLDGVDPRRGILIGIAQALALIPGVSRSGITITAALFLGLSREAAARFSFLLSLPIVFGAALLKVGGLLKSGIPAGEGGPLLAGVVTSAVVGYASVAFLLRYVQRSSLSIFVWYRVILGTLLLLAVGRGI
ncbi:MAG: undecaprenyl-diphosphate phosphatase [Desulfuromonadia bacterium]